MSGTEFGRRRRLTAAALLVLSLLIAVLTATGLEMPGRLPLTLLFVVVAPGWVVAALFAPASPALEWTIAVAAGLAIGLLTAMTMLVLSWWKPETAMIALAVATAVALVLVSTQVHDRSEPGQVPSRD